MRKLTIITPRKYVLKSSGRNTIAHTALCVLCVLCVESVCVCVCGGGGGDKDQVCAFV